MKELIVKVRIEKETGKVSIFGFRPDIDTVEGREDGIKLYSYDNYNEAVEVATRLVETHNLAADYPAKLDL